MDALIVIGMLIVITLVHEAAHALVAVMLGYKLKKIYLGIPINTSFKGLEFTTVILKKKYRGIEFGISWLILGGAVDFYDFDEAPAWKMTLIAFAGPLSNFLMAFCSIWFLAGLGPALTVTSTLALAVLQALGLLVTGQVSLSQLTGPIGFISAMSGVAAAYPLGWLVVWNVINIALFVTNLMPIPALDGGQIFLSWVGQILGKKSQRPIRLLTITSLNLLCAFMVLVMAKDILVGLAILAALLPH